MPEDREQVGPGVSCPLPTQNLLPARGCGIWGAEMGPGPLLRSPGLYPYSPPLFQEPGPAQNSVVVVPPPNEDGDPLTTSLQTLPLAQHQDWGCSGGHLGHSCTL